jgi:hypothetical protein
MARAPAAGEWYWVDCPGCPLDGAHGIVLEAPRDGVVTMSFPGPKPDAISRVLVPEVLLSRASGIPDGTAGMRAALQDNAELGDWLESLRMAGVAAPRLRLIENGRGGGVLVNETDVVATW